MADFAPHSNPSEYNEGTFFEETSRFESFGNPLASPSSLSFTSPNTSTHSPSLSDDSPLHGCPVHQTIFPKIGRDSDFLRKLADMGNLPLLSFPPPLGIAELSSYGLDDQGLPNLQLFLNQSAHLPPPSKSYLQQQFLFRYLRNFQAPGDSSKKPAPNEQLIAALTAFGCVCLTALHPPSTKPAHDSSPPKRSRPSHAQDVSEGFRSGLDQCQAGRGCTNLAFLDGRCGPCSDLEQIKARLDIFGQDIAYYHRSTAPFAPGTIVGLLNGTVQLTTTNVDAYVVPQRPTLKCGHPGPDTVLIAYLGQVNVRVHREARYSSADFQHTPLFVIPSGRHDGLGLLRSLQDFDNSSATDVRIVGHLTTDPWEIDDDREEFLTVRIMVDRRLPRSSPLPVPGPSASRPLATSAIDPPHPVIPNTLSWIECQINEMMGDLPPPNLLGNKANLQHEAQCRFKCTPSINIDYLSENVGTHEPLFGAMSLKITDAAGTTLWEAATYVPCTQRTKKQAEEQSCAQALLMIRREKGCHQINSGAFLDFPPTLEELNASKMNLQIEAQRKYRQFTPQICVEGTIENADAPEPRFGATSCRIQDPDGNLLWECPTPVPCTQLTKKGAEDYSCAMAFFEYRQHHSIKSVMLQGSGPSTAAAFPTVAAFPTASASPTGTASPTGIASPTASVTPLMRLQLNYKVELINFAQSFFKKTPKIRIDIVSILDESKIPKFGANSCHLQDSQGNLLWEAPTPVPCTQLNKKAAENASCGLALVEFRWVCLFVGPTGPLVSVPVLTPDALKTSKMNLQIEAQRKYRQFTPQICVEGTTKNADASEPRFGATSCRIQDPDGNLLWECPTPVPCTQLTKKNAENYSCALALMIYHRHGFS